MRVALTTLVLPALALAWAGAAAAPATAPRPGLVEAVDNGTVSLTMEGVEGGNKVKLTLGNAAAQAASITVPQGETKIPVSTQPPVAITITTTKAQALEVPAGKELSVTFDQVGATRLDSGKITMKKGPDGMVRNFENAAIGAHAK